MDEFNPYEAPLSTSSTMPKGFDPTNRLLVVNSCLVLRKGADLPDICIYSGAAGENIYTQKTLSRAPSWVILLVLLNPLLGLIAYILTRKKTKIGYFVAPEQRSSRRIWLLINWFIFLGGIGAIFVSVAMNTPEIAYACPALLILSLILYFIKVRSFYAEWIDEREVGIRGIKRSIMDRLIQAASPADQVRELS